MMDATKRRSDTVSYPSGILDKEDIWFVVMAAMAHPGNSTGPAELAGRLSLLLRPDDFQRFFLELMRELIGKGAWPTIGDFIDGVTSASWVDEVPVPDSIIRDLLDSPDERVQRAAADLLEHRKTPVWKTHVRVRVVG